jgi:hypothetical protein
LILVTISPLAGARYYTFISSIRSFLFLHPSSLLSALPLSPAVCNPALLFPSFAPCDPGLSALSRAPPPHFTHPVRSHFGIPASPLLRPRHLAFPHVALPTSHSIRMCLILIPPLVPICSFVLSLPCRTHGFCPIPTQPIHSSYLHPFCPIVTIITHRFPTSHLPLFFTCFLSPSLLYLVCPALADS